MFGALVKTDPWLGKDMLFLRVAERLEKQAQTPSALNETDKERLVQAQTVFRGVGNWQRFWEHNEISPSLTQDMEAAKLLSKIPSIRPNSDEQHARRIQDSLSSLTILINGGQPESVALRDAAALCDEIGAYLGSRHASMIADDEDD